MKTYGGFLPFEMRDGDEYYRYDSSQMQYYNSGKTAVYYCIQQLKPKRLFVPRYYCPSTRAFIETAGVPVISYHVRKNLSVDLSAEALEELYAIEACDSSDMSAEISPPGPEDAVLLVNYFGVYQRSINGFLNKKFSAQLNSKSEVGSYSVHVTDLSHDSGSSSTHDNEFHDGTGLRPMLIIDNCQAFYNPPVMADGVLNFYSFKKDFGTPDGALVIGEHVEDYGLPQESGVDLCDYLIGSMVDGTGPWYNRKKELDAVIGSQKLQASKVTRKMIKAIDYERIREIRLRNYRMYLDAFGEENLIKTDTTDTSVPYLYPLNLGANIKRELVARGIFVPTLWADTLDEKYAGTDEYFLSENTLFLPVDQRYGEDDIRYIIGVVRELLNGRK